MLSFINTKLRDEYESLSELCAALNADEAAVCDALAIVDDFVSERLK